MAVVMPERIAVPPRDGETKFEIGLRITNRTNQDISIDLFDTVRPVLKDGQGRELPLTGGRKATRIPEPVEVKAGQNDTVLYAARLSVPEGKNIRDSSWMTAPAASGRITISSQGATRWGWNMRIRPPAGSPSRGDGLARLRPHRPRSRSRRSRNRRNNPERQP